MQFWKKGLFNRIEDFTWRRVHDKNFLNSTVSRPEHVKLDT